VAKRHPALLFDPDTDADPDPDFSAFLCLSLSATARMRHELLSAQAKPAQRLL
jgi:hypothetical protein